MKSIKTFGGWGFAPDLNHCMGAYSGPQAHRALVEGGSLTPPQTLPPFQPFGPRNRRL